ncbi:hypothetical protein ACA910_013273 [Epithemia clementina (nom. ined.)]
MSPQQDENVEVEAAKDEESDVTESNMKDRSSDGVVTFANTHKNNDSDDDDDDGDGEERNLFVFMKGIKEDLRAQAPLYMSDWGRPRNIQTVVNATVFAFVIQLIPALILAELMDRQTDGNLATAETLLSSGIMGIIYAIFSGQPLVIMGITGPVAILLGTSYGLTERFDAEYFPFFFWICIWAGLMHIISSMIGLVHLVWKVTPFTSQIFEFFIAITFIYASVRDLIEPIYFGQGRYQVDRSAQYATLMIGMITFYVAWTLHFAEQWTILTRQVRVFLESCNTLIAVVVGTALSYLPGVELSNNGAGGLERVGVIVPWDWQPTADRPWVTNPLSGIDAGGIMAAIIPGFMFFLLFIIDHNVSSILTQSPKYNLKKPPAYHWDFFVLGVTFIPCAILGLPPGNGLIPQAPLHCRALCTRKFETDEHGVRREVVSFCEEQRWSGLGQALLMFVALASFRVISWIPRGCLFGLFLYLGVGALHGNEIWERITFCLMIEKKRPKIPVVREVKWMTVVFYTFIQAACGFCVFGVAQFASVGYIYPALLTILVPFRSYILSHVFTERDLKYLDPSDKTEEEQEEEHRRIRHPPQDSISTVDFESDHVPHFGDFHPDALKKALKKRKSKDEVDEIRSLPPLDSA